MKKLCREAELFLIFRVGGWRKRRQEKSQRWTVRRYRELLVVRCSLLVVNCGLLPVGHASLDGAGFVNSGHTLRASLHRARGLQGRRDARLTAPGVRQETRVLRPDPPCPPVRLGRLRDLRSGQAPASGQGVGKRLLDVDLDH